MLQLLHLKLSDQEPITVYRRVLKQKRFHFTPEEVSLLFPELYGAGCSRL